MTVEGTEYDVDYAVVGSGFGGSVAALRLAEKGYSVCVLEQGRRVSSDDMVAAARSPRHLLWLPGLRLKGFFSQDFFRHVNVIRGIGVGGGSLVYAAVLLRPKSAFYQDPNWSALAHWEQELAPHYDTASHMLGVSRNPRWGVMDDYIRETARRMGVEETVGSVSQGIFFGGEGKQPVGAPGRQPCTFCGNCITGCAVGAKNSLDHNYLYLAEKRGARIRASRRVEQLLPLPEGGFQLFMRCLDGGSPETLRARKVVLAAGVLGTVELLLRNRDQYLTLPKLSTRLGERVRTNSEAIVAVTSPKPVPGLREGTTISSDFYPEPGTHVTNNRLPPSYEFMKWYSGPLVDGPIPGQRARKVLRELVQSAGRYTRNWLGRRWHERTTVLTVMQQHDSDLTLKLRNTFWGRVKMGTEVRESHRAPSYLPVANVAARHLAEVTGGLPLNTFMESVAQQSVTAHILGGCIIGSSRDDGVVDVSHRVFGYPDLMITDASVIPVNIGVNPSLTITAMAERAMARIPEKASKG